MKPGMVLVFLLSAACATAAHAGSRQHLTRAYMKQLSSEPVMVIYTDAETPVGYYVSWRPPMPPIGDTVSMVPANLDSGANSYGGSPVNPAGGAAGAAGAILVQSLFGPGDIVGEAARRLQPYLPMFGGLPLADEEYAAAKEAMASVPWLSRAPVQRAAAEDVSSLMQHYMRNTSPRAVIVISPSLKLRDDMNEMVVVYRLHIYVRDFYTLPGDSDILTDTAVGIVRTGDKAHGFPIVNYYEKDQSPILDKSVAQYFGDNGSRFHGEFAEALAQAKSQLSYYFTGSDAPASPPSAAVEEKLKSVDPGKLSPKEALELLYELKKLS